MAKPHQILNGIYEGVLCFLLLLFLSLFVRTCFIHPTTQEQASESSVEAVEPVSSATEPVVSLVVAPPVQESETLPVPAEPVATPLLVPSQVVPLVVPATPAPSSPVVPALPASIPLPAPRVPAVPSVKPATVKPLVPQPPFLFEPSFMTQEDYSLFYAAQPAAEGDAGSDPFADFYIAGEGDDSMLYEDGTYYLSLYVNDEYCGEIETLFSGDQKMVNMSELKNYIGTDLTEEFYRQIFGDNHDYLSLEDLAGRSVQSSFDSTAFALYLTIPYSDLAMRTLSVTTRYTNRRDQYAMSGATELKPAKFSWVASMNLYGSVTYPDTFDEITSRSVSWYVNNSLSFLQIGLDFSFSVFNTKPDSFSKWDFNLGNWVAFHEFIDQNQRLTFGSVGSNLSDRTTSDMGITTNIGFTLEKNYSFGGGSAMGSQFSYTISIVEPSTVYVYLNDTSDETSSLFEKPTREELALRKNLIYSRPLQPGVYRLKDFVFTQGLNKVKIYIFPDSRPMDPEVINLDTSYDSRLMGHGDSTWGFGASMPKGMTDSSSQAGSLRYYDAVRGQWASYYPEYFTARFWQSVGVTDTFTMSSDISATPGAFSGTLNGIWANMLGTTQVQATGRMTEAYKSPILSGSVTERFNDVVMRGAGSLSLTFSYNGPADAADDTHTDIRQNMVGSFSYSGTGLVTKLRYSLSGSVSYYSDNDYPTWSVSASTGASPFKGFSVSASATFSSNNADKPWDANFTGTISASYAFSSKLTSSTSTSYSTASDTTSSFGVSYRPSSSDSLSLSLSGVKWMDDPADHTMYTSWLHTGKVYSLTVRQQAYSKYDRWTTSANLSTAIAFADGAFGMARTINDVFLLVKPRGMLRKSPVSVARSMDSSPTNVPKHLGSALYTSLSPYVQNSVVIFSGGEGGSSGASTLFEFKPRVRQAYVAHIDLPDVYTVSASLYHADGSPYEQYSSPVYQYRVGEDGQPVLTPDANLYLFTDQVGRFILSDVPAPGSYAFDLQVGENSWILVRFQVPEMEDKKLRVMEMEDLYDDGPYLDETVDGYDHVMELGVSQFSDEQTFWNVIFPPADELDFGSMPVEESPEPTFQTVQNAAP